MTVKRKGGAIALATILLLTTAFRHHLNRLEEVPTVDTPIERLPMTLGEWKGRDTEGLDVRSQEILKLDRFIKRVYTNPEGRSVLVYVGYWKQQTGEYQAAKHSPELCLPSNGWQIERKPPRSIHAEGVNTLDALEAKRLIGETGGKPRLFYYWFFTGEQEYLEEWRALLTISVQKFFAGRSDGGIVEISTPLRPGEGKKEAIETASDLIEDFTAEFYPALRKLTAQPMIS